MCKVKGLQGWGWGQRRLALGNDLSGKEWAKLGKSSAPLRSMDDTMVMVTLK